MAGPPGEGAGLCLLSLQPRGTLTAPQATSLGGLFEPHRGPSPPCCTSPTPAQPVCGCFCTTRVPSGPPNPGPAVIYFYLHPGPPVSWVHMTVSRTLQLREAPLHATVGLSLPLPWPSATAPRLPPDSLCTVGRAHAISSLPLPRPSRDPTTHPSGFLFTHPSTH